jgi:hypothetical protein
VTGGAEAGVELGEGVVHEEDFGLADEGFAECDALVVPG